MKRSAYLPPQRRRRAGTLGSRLTTLRIARGWTQYDLAAEIGVPYRYTITRWESGTHTPTVPYLFALADALGTTPGYLWRGDTP